MNISVDSKNIITNILFAYCREGIFLLSAKCYKGNRLSDSVVHYAEKCRISSWKICGNGVKKHMKSGKVRQCSNVLICGIKSQKNDSYTRFLFFAVVCRGSQENLLKKCEKNIIFFALSPCYLAVISI